jgi:indolepyruvate ferredoxin oxidoreductase
VFDVFGYTEERRLDRQVLSEYEQMLGALETSLSADNHAVSVELACVPEQIRGYGHIRRRHMEHAAKRRDELMAQLHDRPLSPRPESTAVSDSRSRIVMAG